MEESCLTGTAKLDIPGAQGTIVMVQTNKCRGAYYSDWYVLTNKVTMGTQEHTSLSTLLLQPKERIKDDYQSKKLTVGISLVVKWIRICLPMQGTRGYGFSLWSGKIPHAVEQLSPRATTTEARAL